MGERFYLQRDRLSLNHQPLSAARQHQPGIPTYYKQLAAEKERQKLTENRGK